MLLTAILLKPGSINILIMPAEDPDFEKKEKMLEIIADLKKRMAELDELGKKIKLEGRLVSPSSTYKLLEEIKVPSLKVLKEK